ncbi:MAG TPA: Rv3654c family TadE-like protein [Mycobacteriales bacterium]|nr:Rv3654c family TadE-like protein [Mycobacteriales bacterium]
MTRRSGPDAGFATVWVIAAMALVLATAVAAIGYGLLALARHRAGNAADSAALAAALDAPAGPVAACAAAGELASRDGARLTGCTLDGSVAGVVVSVSIRGPFARFGPAVGRARAGPSARAEVGLGVSPPSRSEPSPAPSAASTR